VRTAGLFLTVLFLFAPPAAAQPVPSAVQGEVIAAIQVHGNTLTPGDDLIKASGLSVGDKMSETTLSGAEARLRASIRLESVDVLKRFASISDPTQIVVVIQVDEGPVQIDVPDIPNVPGAPSVRRVVRRSRFNVMFLPILDAEDGYGFTYGAQFAVTGHRTKRRRMIIPASWGGDKRIAVEYQQEFRSRSAPRLRAGALVQRRTHPFYDEGADRRRVWGRTEWRLLREVRAGAELAWQSTSLSSQKVDARSVGADMIVDTRVDPLMPHNAIFVRSAVERLHFSSGSTGVKTDIDANGYVGLYRGTILALRAVREDFTRPAPAFYKAMLGGSRNLRGFRAGHAIGDTVVAGSAELRIPTTSPLRMARFGVSVFMDAGTAYNKGQRFADQKLERGVGAGVWATAPLLRFSVAVARGIGSGVRAHLGAGLTF
jgi:outer membrane protein assembly factor BamA